MSTNTSITDVCGRIYPIAAPADVDLPLITYQEIRNDRILSWDGTNPLLQSQVIIDVWAVTKVSAAEIANAIIDEFQDYVGALGVDASVSQVEIENAVLSFDPNTGNYGAGIDLTIWWSLTAPPLQVNQMKWISGYTPGDAVLKDDVVRDGQYLMIANTDTEDAAAPASLGVPEYDITVVPTNIESSLGSVRVQHEYTLTTGGWVTAVDICVPDDAASIEYRVATITETQSKVVTLPALTPGEWSTVLLGHTASGIGTKFTIQLYALNSSGSTNITGEWTCGGTSNNSDPADQSWNRRSQNNVLRIDKQDTTGTDRTADLMLIDSGATIKLEQNSNVNQYLTYYITGNATDEGTCITYDVSLSETGPAGPPATGSTTTITAELPIAAQTEYYETADYWLTNQPDWATVVANKAIGGNEVQGTEDNAYGIRVQFDSGYVSPDWDFLSDTETIASHTESVANL